VGQYAAATGAPTLLQRAGLLGHHGGDRISDETVAPGPVGLRQPTPGGTLTDRYAVEWTIGRRRRDTRRVRISIGCHHGPGNYSASSKFLSAHVMRVIGSTETGLTAAPR